MNYDYADDYERQFYEDQAISMAYDQYIESQYEAYCEEQQEEADREAERQFLEWLGDYESYAARD